MSDRQPTVNALLVDINGNAVGVTGGAINASTTAAVATGGVSYPNAAQVTVGAVVVDLLLAGTYKVVILSAPRTNSVPVFWGTTGVTATTGVDLNPGEKVFLTGVDCPTDLLRAISTVAGQIVIVMAAT